jgi:Sulfite exporter TauE/SafE
MSTAAYLLLFLGAVAGGFVSGLAGFGTGLVALGIWLYVLPPSIAVSLVIICSIVAQTSTLPSFWRSTDFKLVLPCVTVSSSLRRRNTLKLRRLALEQPAIDSARPVGERGVGTLLDDLAAIEHQDAVEAAHRR